MHTHIRRRYILVHKRVKIIFACTKSTNPLLKSEIVDHFWTWLTCFIMQLYDDGVENTKKQLITVCLGLQDAQPQLMENLLSVWKGVRDRLFKHYHFAAKAYFMYLRMGNVVIEPNSLFWPQFRSRHWRRGGLMVSACISGLSPTQVYKWVPAYSKLGWGWLLGD